MAVEAMTVERTLTVPRDGIEHAVNGSIGALVDEGAEWLVLDEADA